MSLLKDIRTQTGLSQKDIAELFRVERSYINKIENGKRRIPDFMMVMVHKMYRIVIEYKPQEIIEIAEQQPSSHKFSKVAILERKLFKMQKLYVQQCTLIFMVEELKKGPLEEMHLLWADWMKSEAKYKLCSCNTEKQHTIRVKLERARNDYAFYQSLLNPTLLHA